MSCVLRWVRTPPTAPAKKGNASATKDTAGAAPFSGTAASIGKLGSAPTDTPVGATTVISPNAKPGPSA